MAKLTDTQCILLSSAAQRDDLAFQPLPATLSPSGGVTRAIAALIKAGHAERRGEAVHATAQGLAAIGVVPDGEGETPAQARPEPVPVPATTTAAPRSTKTMLVLDLLGREVGATLVELIAATGWLPHTTRAALTGLRKKGHAIERTTRDGVTCYRIAPAEAAA